MACRKSLLIAVPVVGLLGFDLGAQATPLRTAAGTPIPSFAFSATGVDYENGVSTVRMFAPVPQPNAATKAAIIAADRAAHPSIPAAGNSDPTPDYDCHGLTFKSKTLWINDTEVDTILTDQNWRRRGAGGVPARAQVGDIVIYRNPAARTASHPTDVTHSGVVTQVDAAGNVTEVLSKWGARGDYKHAPTDVPNSYLGANGTIEVRTGGAALRDPPASPGLFGGHVAPPLNPNVAALLSSTDATIFNDFPGTSPIEQTHGPVNWNYALSIPLDGLTISPGDQFDLFGTQWINAAVSGLAALASFGAWVVGAVSAGFIEFEATAGAFVPGDFAQLLDGFTGISTPSGVGEIVYTETLAGSVGLISGPVPEPSSLLLLATSLVCLIAYGRGMPRTAVQRDT